MRTTKVIGDINQTNMWGQGGATKIVIGDIRRCDLVRGQRSVCVCVCVCVGGARGCGSALTQPQIAGVATVLG